MVLSKIILSSLLVLFACETASCWGDVWHLPLEEKILTTSVGVEPVEYTWKYGDRSMPLSGIEIQAQSGKAAFIIAPRGDNLTLEIREFRTKDGQWPAYLVSADGEPFAFRCRRYDEAGPSSAFIDLPEHCGKHGPVRITITNIAPTPLCLSEVFVYSDIEKTVEEAEFPVPMYTGPTVRGIDKAEVERLVELRELVPKVEHIEPKIVVSTVPLGHLPPERTAAWIDTALEKCYEAKVPIEMQVNTWWAGTPSGPDGRGGRWTDVEYQQVTYEPTTGEYGLSIPNRWSSVPWLTVRHPHFNAFKKGMFRTVGQVLRDQWDEYEQKGFQPILDLVTDNEVTYWAGGMAGTSVTAQGDFNPAMVAAAKEQGIDLNPEDGLSEEEFEFLRESIRYYNREMTDGLLEGMGNTPLRDRIYTHTWDKGFVYDNAAQAYEAGVLEKVRLGIESNHHQSEAMPNLEIARELGLPASINAELGGDTGPALHVPLAFAAGCTQVSLFNASDDLLRDTKEYVESGWPSYEPVAWNKILYKADFSEEHGSWMDYFTTDQVELHMGIRREAGMMMGKKLEESNITRLHFTAADLTGKETFNRLALYYKMRAFVHQRKDDNAYLSVRVGATENDLKEVERFANTGGMFRTNVSDIVHGATEVFIEMEFHPLGLTGWVGVFEFSIEEPWEEETLLVCNRSYRADRLRAESLMVGWRADAYWTLQQCEDLELESTEMEALHALYEKCDYRTAFEQGQALLTKHRKDTYEPWQPPAPDREERGSLTTLSGEEVGFDPYDVGSRDRRVPVAENAELRLLVNGKECDMSLGAKRGDDVQVTVRNGQAVSVTVRRGEAEGVVREFTPLTPFSMPMLALEGRKTLTFDGKAAVYQKSQEPLRGSFPYILGVEYFQPGEPVAVRWNPHTEKIVEARYVVE